MGSPRRTNAPVPTPVESLAFGSVLMRAPGLPLGPGVLSGGIGGGQPWHPQSMVGPAWLINAPSDDAGRLDGRFTSGTGPDRGGGGGGDGFPPHRRRNLCPRDPHATAP